MSKQNVLISLLIVVSTSLISLVSAQSMQQGYVLRGAEGTSLRAMSEQLNVVCLDRDNMRRELNMLRMHAEYAVKMSTFIYSKLQLYVEVTNKELTKLDSSHTGWQPFSEKDRQAIISMDLNNPQTWGAH